MFRWNMIDLEFPLKKKDLKDDKIAPAHSPIYHKDDRVLINPADEKEPLMPEDGADFWSEFLEVATRVHYAKKKTPFSKLPKEVNESLMPDVLDKDKPFIAEILRLHYKINTTYDVAMLVRADWPTDIMNKLAGWLYGRGYKQRDFFGYKHTRFTNGVVLLARIIGEVIHSISPTAFAHKYYHGRPRPEQVAGAWARGELEAPSGIDAVLCNYINKEQVSADEKKFGVYPAPPHPSYPAMHSAVAAIHLIMAVWFELDEYGFDQCKRVSAAVGLGRNFGGVHYHADTLYGIDLGERSLEIVLPEIMGKHGIDKDEVKELIARYRTDWVKEVKY